MSATSSLSPYQFPRKKAAEPQEKPKFGGAPGRSKTMKNSAGHVSLKPPDVHPHSDRSSPRSRRAK